MARSAVNLGTIGLRTIFLILLACGGTSNTESSARPAPATPPNPTPAQEPPRPSTSASAPAADAPTSTRLRFDLARNLDRAEQRNDLNGQSVEVADGGTPGFQKYTLGGWRSRFGRSAQDGDTSVAVLEGLTGFLHLPVAAAGELHISLRARAPRDGRITVYVAERTVANVEVSTREYTTVHFRIPAEHIHAGENLIQLRVPGTAALASVANAGLLIDWLAWGQHDVETPSFARSNVGETATLEMTAHHQLGYALELESGMTLRGRVRGSGELQVVRRMDGAAETELARIPLGENDAPLAVALAGSNEVGRIARIELRGSGSMVVSDPQVVVPAPVPETSATPIQNVLIYLTDTLRADKLAPYRENTRVQTPALRRFAAAASVLLRGHGQENWTKPSVATLLSGLFPWEHQATSEEAAVPSAVQLISERLRAQNFYTGAFIANGFCSDRFGFQQGWDTFRNYIREGRRSQAQFVAADVLNWLDARPQDKPFMLYVHTIDPHVPYLPPQETLVLYDSEPYSGIVDFNRDRELLEKVKAGRIQLSTRDRQHLEALYDAEITYHDLHFGSIIEGLERRGLRENTVVVFTADHGEEFFDHGSVGHGHSVYEELIHVPLIVFVPGISEGQRVEDVVGLVDVLPTIYQALGRDVPTDLSGETFLPLLRGGDTSAPRYAVTGFMEGWRALTVGGYKLIQRTDRRYTLYNTQSDPGETNDLANSSPIALRYLRGLLGLGLARANRPSMQRAAITRENATIDPTLRQQLEALGYAGASRPGEVPRPRR